MDPNKTGGNWMPSMPSYQMPSMPSMPSFQMPTFQMPSFQMPSFQMPSFRNFRSNFRNKWMQPAPSSIPKVIIVVLWIIIIMVLILWGIDSYSKNMGLYPNPEYVWTRDVFSDGVRMEKASESIKIPADFTSCKVEPGKGITTFKGGSGADVDSIGAVCWDKTEIKDVGSGGSAYKIESPDGFDGAVVWTDDRQEYIRGLDFYLGEELKGSTGTTGKKDNKLIGIPISCQSEYDRESQGFPPNVITGIKVAN